MLRQYELVERVKAYDPDADEAILNRAYVYTVQKHGSQKRASGDPYFSHPIEVAGLMTELKLDQETIVTARIADVALVVTGADHELVLAAEDVTLVDGLETKTKAIGVGVNPVKYACGRLTGFNLSVFIFVAFENVAVENARFETTVIGEAGNRQRVGNFHRGIE